MKIDRCRHAVIAVIAQGLPCDARDAFDLFFGGVQKIVRLAAFGTASSRQIDKIHYGFQRIVDLVCDGGSHATGRGKLFRLQQKALHLFPKRDIAGNL